MSSQLASWLRDSAEVLSLIADNLHQLSRIVWQLAGFVTALGALVLAWRLFLRRCQDGKHDRRPKR
jgi:hypothetical protein